MDNEMNKLFAVCEQDIQDLNKVVIESSAATAYNEVIFESALDYILNEEEVGAVEKDNKENNAEEKKTDKVKAGFKNSLYKAWETVKRMAAQVLRKIQSAINSFIAKANAGNLDKFVEKNGDKVVTIKKELKISGSPAEHFGLGMVTAETLKGTEEVVVSRIKKKIIDSNNKAQNDSYAPWDVSELDNVKDFKALNSFISSYASKAPEADRKATVQSYFGGEGSFKKVVSAAKTNYNGTVKNLNGIIKNLKATIDKTNTAEDNQAIKDEIAIANKYISFTYAAYSGLLKWCIAFVKLGQSAIKNADKKEAKNESVLEDFYGLSLL